MLDFETYVFRMVLSMLFAVILLHFLAVSSAFRGPVFFAIFKEKNKIII